MSLKLELRGGPHDGQRVTVERPPPPFIQRTEIPRQPIRFRDTTQYITEQSVRIRHFTYRLEEMRTPHERGYDTTFFYKYDGGA